MKREHPNLQQTPATAAQGLVQESSYSGGGGSSTGSGSGYSTMASSSGKGKMCVAESDQQDAGFDELLAVLGYKVKTSDMAKVAQKIEQLEEAFGNTENDGLSYLASETVHHNPSDLSSWLESMISEFNPDISSILDSSTISSLDNCGSTNTTGNNARALHNQPNQVVFDDSSFESDLTAIPGKAAVYPQSQQLPPPVSPPAIQPPSKRMKASSQIGVWGIPSDPIITTSRALESTRPVVLVDSQENGVRLVHTLMACAEAVEQENMKIAEALVEQIAFLAVSQAGAMRKVATYFTEALARRIYRLYPTNSHHPASNDSLQMHFYESCPYLKFAHFTANQAILEAFANTNRVHVIDFSMKQGMQWPALLQALALRPGGRPSFRLTGIGPPSPDNTDHLQEVGLKLAEFAENIKVEFEFRGFVANSLADLDASMFDIREGETVAVNSVFELHQLLARPGAIEKVLSVVKELKPKILTVVEQEANHNGPAFLDRFTESLHYYSTLFDSLESCGGGGENSSVDGGGAGGGGGGGVVSDQDKLMSEVYLGRQICNVVACEGVDRVERHETLDRWRTRFGSAGFEAVHLGSNAFKQASMLLALFAGGDGYRVEENNGCLMLGWHTRPLIATSGWKLS